MARRQGGTGESGRSERGEVKDEEAVTAHCRSGRERAERVWRGDLATPPRAQSGLQRSARRPGLGRTKGHGASACASARGPPATGVPGPQGGGGRPRGWGHRPRDAGVAKGPRAGGGMRGEADGQWEACLEGPGERWRGPRKSAGEGTGPGVSRAAWRPPPRKSHVRVPTPGACGLDLIRKRVFAHGQVEVGSLGRALVPCDCAVMSRGQHTDTHRETAMRDAGRGRRPHARGSGRGGSCPVRGASSRWLGTPVQGPRSSGKTSGRDRGPRTPVWLSATVLGPQAAPPQGPQRPGWSSVSSQQGGEETRGWQEGQGEAGRLGRGGHGEPGRAGEGQGCQRWPLAVGPARQASPRPRPCAESGDGRRPSRRP